MELRFGDPMKARSNSDGAPKVIFEELADSMATADHASPRLGGDQRAG
jgi:hypothetical protein